VVGCKIEEPKFRASVKTIVEQLDEWGMFTPIPKAADLIYQDIYRKLSVDVHVVPDRTDIGNRLTSGASEVFERKVLPEVLREYAELLHQIMDVSIVVELNVMGDLVREYGDVGGQIRARLPVLEGLGLKYAFAGARKVLGMAA